MKLFSAVIILVALSVCRSSAQVFIGSTGTAWNGVCDSSCPQSSPCQLQVSGPTTVPSLCTVSFMGGMSIPSHAFLASSSDSLTFSSLGQVSLAGDVSITATAFILQDFDLSGPHGLDITASIAYIADSSVTFTDNSQITLSSCNSVAIQNSNFSSNTRTFKLNDLATGAMVNISDSNLQNVQGVCETVVSTPGNEPSIYIRNSNVTGLIFHTSALSSVLIENTEGRISPNSHVFSNAPTGTVSFHNSQISSTGSAWMTPSGSSSIGTLKIIGSHFENVIASATASTIQFESSTFTVDQLYDPVINVTDVDSATLSGLSITTRTAIGSASALTSFVAYPYGMGAWSISNIVFTSDLTVPRMRLGGSSMVLSGAFAFPSLEILGSSMTLVTRGVSNLVFTGDITTKSTSTLSFTSAAVFVNSISIGNGVTVSCGSCNQFTYSITDLNHGIRCLGAVDCVDVNDVFIQWSYGLPLAGSTYFFSNSSKNSQNFVSDNNEFTFASQTSNSRMNFTFQEVPCPPQCTPAPNSAHCVSNYFCTCSPGYTGTSCEFTVIVVTPMAVPQDSPQSIAPYNAPSANAPSITPSTTNPTQSPGSSPDSPTSSAQQHASMWYISFGLLAAVLLWN